MIIILKSYKNEAWLRNHYVLQKKSPKEISNICECSPSTINYWLKKFEITRDEINLEDELAYFAFMMINTTGFYQADIKSGDPQRIKQARHLFNYFASNLTNKLSQILMKFQVLHLLKEGREGTNPQVGMAWQKFLMDNRGKELEGLKGGNEYRSFYT